MTVKEANLQQMIDQLSNKIGCMIFIDAPVPALRKLEDMGIECQTILMEMESLLQQKSRCANID